MSDKYLNDKGQVDFIEGTEDGKSERIFKPIGFFGAITVYEEQSQKALAPPVPPEIPNDNWDC